MLRLRLALSSNGVALFIRWVVFAFSFFGKFLPLLDRFSLCRHLQLAGRFRFDPDGPDAHAVLRPSSRQSGVQARNLLLRGM